MRAWASHASTGLSSQLKHYAFRLIRDGRVWFEMFATRLLGRTFLVFIKDRACFTSRI